MQKSNVLDLFGQVTEKPPRQRRKAQSKPTGTLPNSTEPQQLALQLPLALASSRHKNAPRPRPQTQNAPDAPEERPNVTRMVNVTKLPLPARAKQLLAVMIELADYQTGHNCKAKISTYAERCSVSVPTINRALKPLEEGGWIIRTGHLPKGIPIYAIHFQQIIDAYEAEHPTRQFKLLAQQQPTIQKYQNDTSRSIKMTLLKDPMSLPHVSVRTDNLGSRDGATSDNAGPVPAHTKEEWPDVVANWWPDSQYRIDLLPQFREWATANMARRSTTALAKAWTGWLAKRRQWESEDESS